MTIPTAPAIVDGGPRTGAGAAGALVAAGALLVLYPALRPWSDGTPDGAPAAFASPAWIPAHLAAVAGFVLVGFALFHSSTGRLTRIAASLWAAGTALVLPYYGAEAFALHALGERIVRTGDTGLLDVAEATRMGAWQVTTFAAGLLLLAAAGVLSDRETLIAVALIWLTHIAVDRAAGYGFKLPTGFKDTHLG
jgi:hypothetical protein